MENLNNLIKAKSNKTNPELLAREEIRKFFLDLYNEKIEIKGLKNSSLVIKVSSSSLASEINLQKEAIIKDLNSKLVDKFKINKLVIVIG